MATIGENIKRLREKAGFLRWIMDAKLFSKYQSPLILSNYECGRDIPSAKHIMIMADYLKCGWREFFAETNLLPNDRWIDRDSLYGQCLTLETNKRIEKEERVTLCPNFLLSKFPNHKVRLTMSVGNMTILGNIKEIITARLLERRGADFINAESFFRLIREMTGYTLYSINEGSLWGGTFLICEDPENHIHTIDIDNIINNHNYFRKFIDEAAKIILAASKILKVDLERLFMGVNMTYDKAELLIACIALKGAETCGKKEEVSKGYVQILENIKSAIRSSGGLTRFVATDRDIIAEWNGFGKLDRIHINFAKIEGLKDVLTPHVLVKLSNALGLDVRDFFFSDMDREMLDLRYECFKLLWKDGAERAEKETEKELKDKAKAKEFQKCCLGGGEMLGPDYNLRSEWVQDTSFLKYVDCMTALKNAITYKPSRVIEELIKIKEFKDVLTICDNEILKHAIKNVLDSTPNQNQEARLRTFCVIATTKEVRESMYGEIGGCYADELCIDNKIALRNQNARNMLWLIEFFTNNNPEYDNENDRFDVKLKDALLQEILGE
jgi:transcriptional regulator with XRE-family HTH domain